MSATIWAGPVNAQQLGGGLAWPGSRVVFVPCTGDGSPSCGQIAASKSLSEIAPGSDDLYLAAFSAGGSAVKRWLPNPRVRGVYLADGTYTHWESPGKPAVDPTLVEWVVRAAKDPSLRAVFTASSSPNGALPSGAQTLDAIARAAEAQGVGWTILHPAGGTVQMGTQEADLPDRGTITLGGLEFPGARAWTAGGATLLDLGSTYSHGEQATKVAPLLWPLFTRQRPDVEASGTSHTLAIALGVLGIGTAAAAAVALWKGWDEAPPRPA